MVEAFKQFYEALSEFAPVYQEGMQNNAQMPYMTYRYGQSSKLTSRETVPIIVDLWSNVTNDDTAIYTLLQNVRDKFEQFPVINVGYPAVIYYGGFLEVPEPETQISHKQINFTYAIYKTRRYGNG